MPPTCTVSSNSASLSRDDDSIDDVNNAVISDNISLDHVSTINLDATTSDTDGDLGTVHSSDLLTVQSDNSLSKDFAGYDVVGKDGLELRDILQQRV